MKPCPDCGREMHARTGRTPETAWYCEYCQANWKKCCDKCLKPLKYDPILCVHRCTECRGK